jgi:trimethylamine:corrinoid methyltransferase-like protein
MRQAIARQPVILLPFGAVEDHGPHLPLNTDNVIVESICLAAVTLAQSVQPGLPVLYCGRLAVMDPHTGGAVWGRSEVGLVSAATVGLAHRYGLPVNVYGLSTDAYVPSFQSGYERALNAILPTQAKAEGLLVEHPVPPLSEDQGRALDEVMREAEAALV